MTTVRLFGWIDSLARIFGMVLVTIGVLGFLTASSEGRPGFVTGVYVFLAIAGVATIFVVKKKTMTRRIFAGFLNGFMVFCGLWMLFASPDDPGHLIRVILGVFVIVACGLGMIASLQSSPRPDIITRRTSE